MYKYFKILKKHSTSEEVFDVVLKHSLEVLSKSIDIIKKKELYEKVDFELIISGSILHDIGTFEFLENKDKKNYIKHGIIGGEILRKEGLEKQALIAERHIGSGLDKEEIKLRNFPIPHEDFLPISLEERIVCYADKFSSKSSKKTDTIESIESEFKSYGENSYKRFLKLKEEFE